MDHFRVADYPPRSDGKRYAVTVDQSVITTCHRRPFFGQVNGATTSWRERTGKCPCGSKELGKTSLLSQGERKESVPGGDGYELLSRNRVAHGSAGDTPRQRHFP